MINKFIFLKSILSQFFKHYHK